MKDCYKGRQSICNCCDGVPETHFRNLEVIRTPIPITPMVRPKAMQKNMEIKAKSYYGKQDCTAPFFDFGFFTCVMQSTKK